ncbi:MAG: class I SAM-dependent methyltransferase [Gammaproteobacteria bacterium]|nr:class I SAM-dependent methyltransferase [Gammaproteobacteria bacterium]
MRNKRMIGPFIGTMLLGIALVGIAMTTWAQEESIRPGINKPFENPDVENWLARFERDDRDLYTRRNEVVAVLNLKPGMDVADIGAGTGFYTMLFAQEVGPDGTVYALDIAENFITYIEGTAKELGLANVKGIANPPDATTLAPDSVDVVFLAHAYHHFEYPYKMLDSIRSALRPGGVVVLIEFERVEGVTEKFVLSMVRAGKGTFTDEFRNAGFELIEELPFSEIDYILKFRLRQ